MIGWERVFTQSAVIGHAAMRMERGAREGKTLFEALLGERIFPHSLIWMISAAERRGDLPEVLLHLGEFYKGQADRDGKIALLMMGPILIIVMGMLTGFVVVSLFLPLIRIAQQAMG